MGSSNQPEAWARAVEAARAVAAAAQALTADENATLATIRAAVRGLPERKAALLLLCHLPTQYTVALTDELVGAALSQRETLLVRQILGRMPRHEVVSVVPPAVWRQLAATPDADAYRRLAEVLRYLGLDDALRELCEAALESDDPEIREVGEDFQGE